MMFNWRKFIAKHYCSWKALNATLHWLRFASTKDYGKLYNRFHRSPPCYCMPLSWIIMAKNTKNTLLVVLHTVSANPCFFRAQCVLSFSFTICTASDRAHLPWFSLYSKKHSVQKPSFWAVPKNLQPGFLQSLLPLFSSGPCGVGGSGASGGSSQLLGAWWQGCWRRLGDIWDGSDVDLWWHMDRKPGPPFEERSVVLLKQVLHMPLKVLLAFCRQPLHVA